MIKESFVLRVLAITFIFIALPLIVISFVLFQSGYQNAINQTKDVLRNAAEERTYALIHIRPVSPSLLGEIALFLDLAKNFPSSPNMELSKQLEAIAAKLPTGIKISLVGKDAKNDEFPILSSSDTALTGQSSIHSHDRLASLATLGRIEYIHAIYVEGKNYTYYYYVAMAIFGADGKTLLGYLVVGINIDSDVKQVLESSKRQYPTLNFALAGRETVITSSTDPSLIGNYFAPLSQYEKEVFLERRRAPISSLAENPLPNTLEPDNPSFEFTFNGETQLAYFEKAQVDVGQTFIAYVSKENLFKQAIRRFLIIYNAYGLIILLGGGATFYLSLYFARPLKNFSGLMERVRTGDFESRFVKQPWGFEINSLGEIFNHTLDSVLLHMKKAEDFRVKKETRQKEIEIGYDVQRQLLPMQMPELKNIELGATYQSSDVAGGDFYDVLVKKPSKVVLLIADAATKGIPACLYALGMRSLLRSYTMLKGEVDEIINSANHMFCEDTLDTGMFVTLFYGCYDLETKLFTYISCGHVPGLLRLKNGEVIQLETKGGALGLSAQIKYASENIKLSEGDLLVFYTDGVIEARNEREEKFSLPRLKTLLEKMEFKTSQEVVEKITETVREYSKGHPQEEDITLLVAYIKEDR